MPLQVDAVYENGVLRPLQPLDLREHEHVLVSVVQDAARDRSGLAVEYIEKIKRELQDAEPAPGLEEVRRRLAMIPGSMAAEKTMGIVWVAALAAKAEGGPPAVKSTATRRATSSSASAGSRS